MKFDILTRRAAAAGAASALVAGAMVAVTGTAAQAVPVGNTYTCQGVDDPFPVALTSDAPGIEQFPSIGAGFDVSPTLLTVTNTFTVPSAVITTAQGLGITHLAASDFAGSIGTTEIAVEGVSGALADATDNGNGTHSFAADGTNAAFEIPTAGTYDVVSPAAFTIDAMNSSGTVVFSFPCELAEGTTAGSYHILEATRNESSTTAKAKDARIRKGETAKIVVKVAGPVFQTPSGKVVLKNGKKTLAKGNLNKKGKVVLKAKKGLKVGKNRLVASYKGDGYTTGSKDKVVVRVKRR